MLWDNKKGNASERHLNSSSFQLTIRIILSSNYNSQKEYWFDEKIFCSNKFLSFYTFMSYLFQCTNITIEMWTKL